MSSSQSSSAAPAVMPGSGHVSPGPFSAEENEAWYDVEISPALAALALRCEERGMAFAAAVEYKPGAHAGTYLVGPDACLPMQMVSLCSRTAPNVDAYMISLLKLLKARREDTGQSIALRAFGG